MNKEKIMKAMKTSISEVLEKMFFMPVDFLCTWVGQADALQDEKVFAAKLAFDGPSLGFFQLLVPGALARRVSADFMGIEVEELTEEDVAGTVKEMVNMLVGNTFSIYDADKVFNLKIPEIETRAGFQTLKSPGFDITSIDIDTLDNRLVLELALKH